MHYTYLTETDYPLHVHHIFLAFSRAVTAWGEIPAVHAGRPQPLPTAGIVRFGAYHLPEKARLVIQHSYFKQVNFSRLTKSMGITKGWVPQIHKRALQLLMEELGENQFLHDFYWK